MMIKTHLVSIIIVVSLFLLTIQFLVLQSIVKINQTEIHHIWKSLYKVTSLAFANDIPIFLIDGKLLKKVADLKTSSPPSSISPLTPSSTRETYCLILCNGQKVTHFAALGEFTDHRKLSKFVQSLRDDDLTVLEFVDLDPTLLHHDLKVTIPLHLIIFKPEGKLDKSHVVHLAILHDRLDQYWWSSSFNPTDYEKRLILRQGARKADFINSDYSLIYPKVEILNTIIDGMIIGSSRQPETFWRKPQDLAFIEPNRTRAKKFYSMYGHYKNEELERHRYQVKNLLAKVKTILDGLGIPFWLSSGTCLGYYRQCDVIPYSTDVDIGIFIQDYRPEMIDYFYMNHLPLLHVFGKPEDSYELSFRDNNLKLDVFFFYEDDDYVWNGGTQAKTGLKFKYIFPKFTLCWTEFLDLLMRIPCDTLAYIESNYGSNWSVPIEQWDWKSSPPNVSPNGRWPLEEWHKVIQLTPSADVI